MNYYRNSISFGDLKQAALFFDRIAPFNLTDLLDPSISNHREKIIRMKLFNHLCFGDFEVNNKTSDTLKYFVDMHKSVWERFADRGLTFEELGDTFQERQKKFYIIVGQYLLSDWSVVEYSLKSFDTSKGWCFYFFPESFEVVKSTDNDCTITMSQLSIVDTQKLSWKQIYEVRKDTKSWERLKRFRLFFHENYSDKDIHFIEDDLQTRIADYHLACKEHGFETINGVFQKVTSSQTLIGATGTGVGAIVSHQLGLPLTIPLAAISATAIALELGSILLEVAKGKLSLGKLKETHEVAYIVDLKKRVKSK